MFLFFLFFPQSSSAAAADAAAAQQRSSEKRQSERFFLYKKGRASDPLDIYRRKREIFIKCGAKNQYLWYSINVIAIQNIQKEMRK